MFGKLSVYSDYVCSSDSQTGVFFGKSYPSDPERNSRCGSVLAILTSVRLRSVGKNPQKAKALSGVLGISFLKSGEMAEEMHAAMCCRGFTGEYKKKQKYTLCAADIFSTFIMAGCIVLFWYLNRKI